jgi:hypothetical protein
MKGWKIMAESLTDAVVRAVVIAGDLVTHFPEQLGDELMRRVVDVPGMLRVSLEALHRDIVASNDLVIRAPEFRGHYATIPDPVGDVSEPSYHELGRALAQHVFQGVCAAAGLMYPFEEWDFHRVLDNLPAVQKYLANKAPRFDSHRLVANMQDEAAKAAQRLKLPAGIGGQAEGGTGKSQPKGNTATVAARMIDLIRDPATHTWTAEQFRVKLGCKSRSTITNTAAWKQLVTAREMARQQRGAKPRDRRRKPMHYSREHHKD